MCRMAWSQGFLAALIHIQSKSTRKSRLTLNPGEPGPISVRAVKWIDCADPVCWQVLGGERTRTSKRYFQIRSNDNSPLRLSNCIRVVENAQIHVGPQITSMNRTAEAHIFELQSEWFRFIVYM